MSKCIFYIDVLACTITLLTSKYSISDNRDYLRTYAKGFIKGLRVKIFERLLSTTRKIILEPQRFYSRPNVEIAQL